MYNIYKFQENQRTFLWSLTFHFHFSLSLFHFTTRAWACPFRPPVSSKRCCSGVQLERVAKTCKGTTNSLTSNVGPELKEVDCLSTLCDFFFTWWSLRKGLLDVQCHTTHPRLSRCAQCGTIQNNNCTRWCRKKCTRWVTQKNIWNQESFTAGKWSIP